MPVISIEFNDFKDLLGKDMSKEDFIDTIPLIGADVERIDNDEINIEFFPPDPATERGDQRAHLGGGQHFVEAGLLHIEDLAFEGKNGL